MKTLKLGDVRRRSVIASALLAGLVGCGGGGGDNSQQPTQQAQQPQPVLKAGAVSSPNPFGAQAAKQVLDQGGNAVDAGVAVAFALAVTFPAAGNIGGGGFMTIYMEGKPYFVDYREKAPGAATPTMYLDASGNVVPGLSLNGSLASGVPGTVAGLQAAHQKFGKLRWSQVMAPAIGYARDGFTAYDTATPTSNANRGNFNNYFGGKMIAGQAFKQPELAATLQRISDGGADEFYKGQTADLLVAQMRRTNGIISKADLANYKAVWRDPVAISFNGHMIYTAPPPSSGGFGIGQLVKMKSFLAPRFASAPLNSAQYIHLTAEMEKRVFADRAQYLGDSDFFKVPMTELLSDDYLRRRALEVNPQVPTPLAQVQPGLGTSFPAAAAATERPQTTHFSIVDKWGNAVSNTYTLNGGYGSGIVVEGAGFLLNNEMDDFAAKPGVPNQFGVVGSDANSVQPNKRPLSSMSPTIATKDGKVALVAGTPGGSRIFTSVYQVLVDVLDYNLPIAEAQAQPRFHHQLLPDNVIEYEASKYPASVAADLTRRGWIMRDGVAGGLNIEAVQVIGDTPVPVTDPRSKSGLALVVPPVN
jgi:gamma-glutamyltranspeptidase/glutathione hydrolase